jgi:hypothetical protein
VLRSVAIAVAGSFIGNDAAQVAGFYAEGAWLQLLACAGRERERLTGLGPLPRMRMNGLGPIHRQRAAH